MFGTFFLLLVAATATVVSSLAVRKSYLTGRDIFHGEKLVGDKPFVEQKVLPRDMTGFMMHPVKIKGSVRLDAFYIALIGGSLFAMGVIDWMQR